ncbi:MAG: histone deacetylase [Nitrospirae bacterium]|nr:MAG: histone deacetylase [Nitrospirota bacterium]
MGRVGFVWHPAYLDHEMGPGHPESPDRLHAILSHLDSSGTRARLTAIEPYEAPREWLTRIHDASYLADLERRVPARGYARLDPDTALSPGSFRAAVLAAGGAMAAVDAILAGQVDQAFCAVRPPGHHAEAGRAMGFCLINNVAVAVRYIQHRYGMARVLIVDWDVHHGNGTQHAFEDDDSVLFFSTHQFPHYPGTGASTETGRGKGKGYTINVPLAAGQGDEAYQKVFETVLVPAAETFRPQFVLISAGFDAHRDDPLGGMRLTEDGYAALTHIVMQIAHHHASGRVLSCLEGGYHLPALARSVERHLLALLDS